MEANPYAPPQSEILVPIATDSERIRQEHLKVEKTVKTAGILYILGALAFLFLGGTNIANNASSSVLPFAGLILLAIGLGLGVLGFGLHRLQPWARWVAIPVACLGLLNFPIGTLISGLILANLFGKKAAMVFSEPYKQIIAESRHVKYKTSKVSVTILVILLVGLAAILIYNFFLAGR